MIVPATSLGHPPRNRNFPGSCKMGCYLPGTKVPLQSLDQKMSMCKTDPNSNSKNDILNSYKHNNSLAWYYDKQYYIWGNDNIIVVFCNRKQKNKNMLDNILT